jgi:hypothetical protein
MTDATTLSFRHLAGDDAPWLTSLAYWIGPCIVAELAGAAAGAIASSMSYQYDIEEQAERTGRVLSPDAGWETFFNPVAPVQLTRAWSPLPAAVDLLGTPDWSSVETESPSARAAAYAWTTAGRQPRFTTAVADGDHERFRQLLAATMVRADRPGWGILIAAKPGWSYDHGHAMSPETRQLMEDSGFVVTDRHA